MSSGGLHPGASGREQPSIALLEFRLGSRRSRHFNAAIAWVGCAIFRGSKCRLVNSGDTVGRNCHRHRLLLWRIGGHYHALDKSLHDGRCRASRHSLFVLGIRNLPVHSAGSYAVDNATHAVDYVLHNDPVVLRKEVPDKCRSCGTVAYCGVVLLDHSVLEPGR